MNQEDAFIADVIDDPDDDAARLIFADWLEDHGQSERAEFIRLQVESDRTDVYDPRLLELNAREAQLLERNQTAWLTRLRSSLAEWTFRRGLLDEVTVRVDVLLKKADRLARHPIRALNLRFEPGDADRAGRVADCPALANVRSLRLVNGSNLTVTAVGQLAASPHLGRLRHLDLSDCRLGEDAVTALVCGPLARRLESLDLSHNLIRVTGAESIAGGGFAGLKSLRLGSTQLGNASVEALAASARLPLLEALDLSENDLGTPAARALAGCRRLAELRRLNLAGNSVGTEGAVALARSPHLRRLETLQLRSNRVGASGVAEFARGGFLDSMRYLELSGNAVTTAGVRSLTAASPARLEYLLLGTDEVDDDALKALARWPALASVRELNFYNNSISAFGMRALIDSPHAKSLCRMNLERNRLGDLGAEVLSVWPGLAGMRWLKLRENNIGVRGAMALAGSPHLCFLLALDLSANDVEGAKQAFESPEVRSRLRDLAPWGQAEVSYTTPFSPCRPRG